MTQQEKKGSCRFLYKTYVIQKIKSVKQYSLFLLFIIFILFACTHKSIPVITDRKPMETMKPVAVKMPASPDTAIGHAIFSNRCNRCHALPDPANYTITRWQTVLSIMIPRARLDTVQGFHLKAFVLSRATKP